MAAGKGTKYLPAYHASTPETLWPFYGITDEDARAAGMNATMFNSFLDGTKSAIEMAAVANCCDLDPPADGLTFPPCGVADLAATLAPLAARRGGGARGTVEEVSSLQRDGREVAGDLRWGAYVVFEAPIEYAAANFRQYGMKTDPSGRFAALYRPYHLIGMELGVSIFSAALRGEATGSPRAFRGDVAAVAKWNLRAGERLDGEGGYTVWGKLIPPRRGGELGALPIGLAKDRVLTRDVAAGATVVVADLEPQRDAIVDELRLETCGLAPG